MIRRTRTSDVKAANDFDGVTFLKDRGINIKPTTLAIDSFVDGKKPDALSILEVGDVLTETKVLILRYYEGYPNGLLEPLDKPVDSMGMFEGLLTARVQKKDLAVCPMPVTTFFRLK